MDKQTHAIEARYIRDKAQRHLQSAIDSLQSNIDEMQGYLGRLDAATTDAERAWVMNSAINHLASSIHPNLWVDLLAESQAELAVLACGECGSDC